ncbi:MAG UNVERIFIED_CONTAM: hypothetical protein LVQ98_07850 [Rickettsiaceae bacterium]|jgi:hypothetical protein
MMLSTGAVDVANAGTTVAFVAVTVTAVPVSTVTTNSTTSSESTELSVGTGIVIGVAAAVPAVCAVHVGLATVPVFFFTEVTTIGAALAGVASVPKVMAATIPRAIFLNDFI